LSVNTNTNYSSSDYNGFRPNPGEAVAFQWNSPPWNVVADYSGLLRAIPGTGRGRGAPAPPGGPARGPVPPGGGGNFGANPSFEMRRYATLAEYSKATHQDEHSVLVDYDIFVNVKKLDARDIKRVQQIYKAEDSDFRLKPASAAVDKGVVLPNITDRFAGKAPDLGALELGQAPPHYGPRQ